MNAPAELTDRIYRMISDLTAVPVEEIRPEHRLRDDLGMDSVSSLELVSVLSEELDLDLDIEEAIGITDVAGVVRMARDLMEQR